MNSKGFTLVEILIAIFIFAVVLTTIYTSYTGTVRVVNQTESEADIYQMARIAMERMIEDLESVYLPQNGEATRAEESDEHEFQFVGEDREIRGRSADTLRFISRSHVDLSGEDQGTGKAEIGYYVRENDGGDGFVLYRIDRPMLGNTFSLDEETGGLVLCERLMSVDFSYYDKNGEVYRSWDPTSEGSGGKIPRKISISLEFVNASNPEMPFKFMTIVTLPLGQG
jgi:general secretion pathway protein J